MARVIDVIFCSETFISYRRHIFELIASGFCRPLELLKRETDRFRGLAVYVRDSFSAYRRHSNKCE